MKIDIPKDWIMARTQEDEGEIGAGNPAALAHALTPESVAYGLKPGDRWGAYWLHADGMMRLFPPDNAAAAPREPSALTHEGPQRPEQPHLSSPNIQDQTRGHGH